jgi:hypothetical protein
MPIEVDFLCPASQTRKENGWMHWQPYNGLKGAQGGS